MAQITLHYNESKNIYQALNEDAHKVWDAMGINENFGLSAESYNLVEVKPENVDLFTRRMREVYEIEVITNNN